MNKIRYVQRKCSDKEKINDFLTSSRVGVLGMNDENSPYAVPLNYVWYHDSIFFHGAGSGRKELILSKEPKVCFTVFEEFGTVLDPMPCHADTSYMSVMLFGQIQRVMDFEESANILDQLVEKYTPGYYKKGLSAKMMEKYLSDLDGNPTSVYRLKPTDITAKENVVEEDELFKSGDRI
ncbi:pyridoxamine 5'-phosphate oxidase-related FMN-binding protein [Methanobacterium lacus]|uniref:Pyridoxamine 5'-phosphate oxidase-related FMN-binding protein n=1 Tax=Methanobacterium lacus (strain AL-21) TaxID=877455 RepID=F0TA86_METLA|nr:pyridoxamine 5'-phosphate oxidase family protein [Methanobacterium lacus]ADZ10036.1 pyridoxamine 5'-phosphate oxidase-related FMN-binding protein [Methanobacterium lacus]